MRVVHIGGHDLLLAGRARDLAREPAAPFQHVVDDGASVYVLYGLGWVLVFLVTFMINHFDLFGLRQVWLYLRGVEYTPPGFRIPALYKVIRHPLYLGWLIVFWSAPTMTAAHLLFAMATTVYILLAIQWEEADLIDLCGQVYRQYRENTPMLFPWKSTPAQWVIESRGDD
ncbi:MAG: hypothetical protein HYX26_10140 [Acidobacteriales bacterium]|nr:hypothetical protein [Terriglobales bacterium]